MYSAWILDLPQQLPVAVQQVTRWCMPSIIIYLWKNGLYHEVVVDSFLCAFLI
jgi:hypothetical protein